MCRHYRSDNIRRRKVDTETLLRYDRPVHTHLDGYKSNTMKHGPIFRRNSSADSREPSENPRICLHVPEFSLRDEALMEKRKKSIPCEISCAPNPCVPWNPDTSRRDDTGTLHFDQTPEHHKWKQKTHRSQTIPMAVATAVWGAPVKTIVRKKLHPMSDFTHVCCRGAMEVRRG